MKLPRRLILKIAIQVIQEQGAASQYEIHTAIEEKLNRQLSFGEKIRVTKVLEYELTLKEVKRDSTGYRIYIFEL